MKICPNCLIGVSKEKHYCHQCGQDIDKSLSKKSKKTVFKSRSSKSEILHKFKFLKLPQTKRLN
jgi:predicted amidophosphoribosyltransferase